MNTEPFVKALLDKNASLDELRTLSSTESLSVEDIHYLQIHILIATSIKELPKERIPESLLKNLYLIEQSSSQRFMVELLRETKQSLPYIVILILGILLFNTDLIIGQIVIVNAILLSAVFGFLFYHLFKSKFFIV
jgi:hypothetical protein